MLKHSKFVLLNITLLAMGCNRAMDEASVEESVDTGLQGGGGGLCCITYTCPTNPEIERTGCKDGPSGPGGAFQACHTACGTLCTAGDWDCE